MRYIKSHDALLTQLDVYTEEKFEDEEEMRENARISMMRSDRNKHTRSGSEIALEDLISLAKKHGELYPMMVDILNRYGQILQRDVGM